VGLRLLAVMRPRAVTKASPLNRLVGLASFIGGSVSASVYVNAIVIGEESSPAPHSYLRIAAANRRPRD